MSTGKDDIGFDVKKWVVSIRLEDSIRFVGWCSLVLVFIIAYFASTYEDRWVMRGLLFVVIVLNIIYNKLMYPRLRGDKKKAV